MGNTAESVGPEIGASALSVLTDEEFFHGSLTNLVEASAEPNFLVCAKISLWTIQILEALATHHRGCNPADPCRAGDDATFRNLLDRAESMDLDASCEVHNMEELKRALEGGADVIGVNSRDLRTFHVSLDTLIEIAESIP